jgi:hypothetical protein
MSLIDAVRNMERDEALAGYFKKTCLFFCKTGQQFNV